MDADDHLMSLFQPMGSKPVPIAKEVHTSDSKVSGGSTAASVDIVPDLAEGSVGETTTMDELLAEYEGFEHTDTRIATIGNVDSGKSTLIGVLTGGGLDDGRGSARSIVLKHRHEVENGRTSAATVEIMGYKENTQVFPTSRSHIQKWTEIMQKCDRTVTLIDLCGHEKYLKTTLFGLTGLMPDYVILVVGGNMGVQLMTREHISIACALNIPMIVAFTKLDISPPDVLKHSRRTLAKILRNNNKMPFPVKDLSSVHAAAESIFSNRITPVFSLSAVTGLGIDLIRAFLSQIRRSPMRYRELDSDPEVTYDNVPRVHFPIDSVYEVKGVGIIIGGTLMRGCMETGNTLYMGPDKSGVFIPVSIRSIECRRTPFTEIKTGQSATVCVKPLNRKVVLKKSYFRKGMVVISGLEGLPKGSDVTPAAIREFEASVIILHHSTMISTGYQPVIHCGVLRQSAEILGITGTDSLKTGERAIVRFRFLYFAEYILPGATFLFREGRAKGVGKVVRTFSTRVPQQGSVNRTGISNRIADIKLDQPSIARGKSA